MVEPKKKYAEGTKVTLSRSRDEIEKLLKTHGATGFVIGYDNDVAAILFQLQGRRYRIELHYPPVESFRRSPAGAVRTELQMREAAAQEEKRMWRELALVIKAKLIAVKANIRTLEQEFMSDTVMTDNRTVGEFMEPQIAEMYKTGKMPDLLPGLGGPSRTKRIGKGDAVEGDWSEQQ